MQEQGKHADFPPAVGKLSKFADRSVEIIAFDRKIVGITSCTRFLKRGENSVRIGASVVHIVAKQAAAASHFCQGHGGSVSSAGNRAAMVRNLQAAAEFSSQKRKLR